MGAKLLIDTVTVSSGVSTIQVGGANWDNSYNVYQVIVNGLKVDTDNVNVYLRILDNSNAAVTASEYDWARKILKSDASFSSGGASNQDRDYFINNDIGTGTGEVANGILYLFNFNDANERSFYTTEEHELSATTDNLQGFAGGGCLTQTALHKGIQFSLESGNFTGGSVSLYGLRK